MAVADEIVKTSTNPRVVVDIYNGSTHRYYGYTSLRLGSDFVEGRLLSVSSFSLAQTDQNLQLTQCSITLADNNRELYNLNIKQDWDIIVYLTYPVLGSISAGLSWEFNLQSAPHFQAGELSLRCISKANNSLGTYTHPVLQDGDFGATTENEFLPPRMSGKIWPVYFGRWIGTDAIPCTYVGTEDISGSTAYQFAFMWQGSSTTRISEANIEVYLEEDGNIRRINRYFQEDALEAQWALKNDGPDNVNYILVYGESARSLGITGTSTLYVSLYDGSGEETPIETLKTICTDYMGLSASVYDATSLTAAENILKKRGIYTQFSLSASSTGFKIISDLITQSGAELYIGGDGKIYSQLFADTNTNRANSYSAYTLYRDALYALDTPQRSDLDPLNEAIVKAHGGSDVLADTNAQVNSRKSSKNYNLYNISISSAYQAIWRELQKARNVTTAIRYSFATALPFLNKDPGDLIRFAEQWRSWASDPAQIISLGIDLSQMKIDVLIQLITGWTSTNAYILLDEDTTERTYPTTTATVTNGSGNVTLSTGAGDSYDIAIGDVFETFSYDAVYDLNKNAVSTLVTTAPYWTGSAWVMVVANTVWTNEAIAAADWRVTKPYPVAGSTLQNKGGFLCDDTDDEFSDNDPGKAVGF